MGQQEQADVLGMLERVVLPVIRALVHDDESVDELSLVREGTSPSQGRSDLLVTVTIEDEPFRWIALTEQVPPESEPHARTRFASDLQDFIAESRFAWGQRRPHPF